MTDLFDIPERDNALSTAGRAVPEWIGANPDSVIPQRVRARVFAKYNGRCYLSGRKLGPGGSPWQIDHIKSLRNGGENRETNLAPIAVDKHKEKTAEEATVGAKADRIFLKHNGAYPKSPFKIRGRGFARRGAPA